jgi:hypothetical protein
VIVGAVRSAPARSDISRKDRETREESGNAAASPAGAAYPGGAVQPVAEVSPLRLSAAPGASLAGESATPPIADAPVKQSTPAGRASPDPNLSPYEAAVPESARTVIANFYAAYRQKDRERLAAMFVVDSTEEQRRFRERLFTGAGDPQYPYLFSSPEAGEVVTTYAILGGAPQEENWLVTVRESRVRPSGRESPPATVFLVLTPAASGQGTWEIQQYTHANQAGKYNGFLLE